MSHPESATALLESVAPIVGKAQTSWKQGLGFRSFALFDPKETTQTRIIAGLLDPRGNHGQREEFLRRFLKEIGVDHNIKGLEFTDIRTEFMTRSIEAERRRIDLLITLPTEQRIALESKARGAKDQPNQIKDYLKQLDANLREDNLLLYLSSDKRATEEICKGLTDDQKGRVLCRGYNVFICKWLKSCEDFCDRRGKDLKLGTFLKEFREYSSSVGEWSPLMSKPTITNVTKEILASKKHLMGAMAIQNSQKAMWIGLAKRFLDALQRQLESDPRKDGWNISRSEELEEGDYFYFYLSLKLPHWKTFQAMLQITIPVKQSLGGPSMRLGINGEGAIEVDRKIHELLRKILPRGKGNARRNGWAYCKEEYDIMNCEDFATLLYEHPSQELQRLAKLLIETLRTVSPRIDAFEKSSQIPNGPALRSS